MSTKLFGAMILMVLTTLLATAADETNWIFRGVVKDEAGKALSGVKVQVCGLNTYVNGGWHKIFRSGIMPSYSTDTNGMFSVTRGDTNLGYNVYFDKPGYAPVFLETVVTNGSDVSVVLKRGMTLTGTVRHVANGRMEPVSGTQVELQLPTADLWYQSRTMTDHEGNYKFQVLPPPAGKKWQVRFGGENVQVDVKEGEPVKGPDFDMEVKVRNDAPEAENGGSRAMPGDIVVLTQDGSRILHGEEATQYVQRQKWMQELVKEAESIHVGSRYAELAKHFNHDGGPSAADLYRFGMILCPFIKVDVEFTDKDEKKVTGIIPSDARVSKISSPYFQQPYAD